MVDFGGSTALNLGANRTSTDTIVVNAASQQANQNPANAVFNLNARFLARERGPLQPAPQQRNQQIDPALLLRIALEEELKKRGGGGGGFRSFNPLLFVPYSFKLLAQAIDRLRQAFNQALNNNFALPTPVTNAVQSVQNYIAGALNTRFVANLTTAVNQSFAQIANAMRNPLATAQKIVMNVVQLANVIASAVAAGLKKVFTGKEEDRFDPDNKVFQEDEGFLRRIWGMFADVSNDANQSNAKNIKSHIDNLAKQFTKWGSAITHPLDDFTKRWFQ